MSLDFAKLCGKHSAIYEAYYRQIDPKATGTIEAMVGAKFLKKSGLSDIVLSRVWDLADPKGKGSLDKPGFFVALKMVAVAQSGETVNMKNIYLDTENPPKVGEIPKAVPPRVPANPVTGLGNGANADWSISVIDRLKYEQLFESLKPVNGMLPGNKVKGVLMDSKLPMDTLGKIWDLADQDRDGNLDKHEFLVAMHLVYKTLEKRSVPNVLPVELRKPVAVGSGGPPPKPAPPMIGNVSPAVTKTVSGDGFSDGGFVANFPKDIAPPPVIPPLPGSVPLATRVPPIGAPITTQPLLSTDPLIPIGAPPSVTANADWVVIPSELKRYEIMFRDSDRDKDGLVSGLEVKNIFLQSGVPQNCLAHIWALCDTNQSGKLTLEQFALAMWMVERKEKGIEPPQVLTANMVPPSLRGILSGVDVQQQEPKPTYSNPELEMISKEIEELSKERRALETEIAQKEADIRIKTGEVRSLQSELDTLSATLKQLEHQRGEAEKRLDDLKAQVSRIREQCQKQEETINEQEGELNAKRSEFQKLKDEESALQKEYEENNRELQKLTNHLQNTQLQISSVRSMVTQLMETQRQMTDALLICRAAIESQNAELVSEYQLKIEPDFDDARKTLEKKINEPKSDPFNEVGALKANISNGFASNDFDINNDDPFINIMDNKKAPSVTDFDDSFNASNAFDSGFDAFGSNISTGLAKQPQKDPFGADSFGDSKTIAVTPEPGKDDFGSDPFAALHAPTGKGQVLSPNSHKSGPPGRPESPSPALPPKKSKVPPPRPAPPRPLQGPARPTQPNVDTYGSSNNSSGFADFADFENKPSNNPSITPFSHNVNFLQTKSITSSIPSDKNKNQNSSLFDLTSNFAFSTTANSLGTNTILNTNSNTSAATLSNLSSTFSLSTPNVNIVSTNTNTSIRSTTPSVQQVFNTLNYNKLNKTPRPMSTSTTFDSSDKKPAGTTRAITPVVAGPTDFSDDPFKDYRYDDLCNIQDPFADDEDLDPEKIFKDIDFPDELSVKTEVNFSSSEMSSNKLINKFNTFQISSSSVQPNQSNHSSYKPEPQLLQTPLNIASKPSNISAIKSSSDHFGNFANFDAFASNSNLKVETEAFPTIKTNNNNKIEKFSEVEGDKTLNSLGKTIKNSLDTNGNVFNTFPDTIFNNNAKDPFGLSTSTYTKISQTFPTFDDDFASGNSFKDSTLSNGPSLSSFDAFTTDTKNNNEILKSNQKSPESDFFNINFAKFDAFDDDNSPFSDKTKSESNSTQLNNSKDVWRSSLRDFDSGVADEANSNSFKQLKNLTSLSKISNENRGKTYLNNNEQSTTTVTPSTIVKQTAIPAKLSEKFSADYSKPEDFDADLEEAIQRSMIDQ